MNTRFNLLRSMVAAAVFVPVVASANPAVTTQGVTMYAGPDSSYPPVAQVGPGFNVNVVGCVEGWQWCDVTAGRSRGWVYSGYLASSYYDRPTVIAYGGPTLGIPLVSFAIAPYWERNYRGRPFWNNRAQWYNHRVAQAPQWHAPPGHGNDWRGHDNGRGNDWRGHDNGRGNDGRSHDNNGRGNDRRGNDDRRAASENRQGPGQQPWSGNPNRPAENDGFHTSQQ